MKQSWVKFLLLWLFCSIAAVYIRLYPMWGHIWSPTYDQATMAVVFNIKKALLTEIHGQYPQMPIAEASTLASVRLNEVLRQDNVHVRQAIEKVNAAMAAQNGQTKEPVYLLEADPFYFYNLTENIVHHGRMAKVIKGNKYFNPLMVAPTGYWQPLSLHPYVGLLMYKIGRLFNPKLPLMTAVAFTPLFITVLALGAFLWCGRLWNLGYPALLAGCFYLAMAPIFLKRSSLGWYDTDPYNLLFPLLFIGIFFKASSNGSYRQALWSAAALAVLMIAFSLIWQGWVLLFFMALLCAGAMGFWSWFFQKNKATALGHLALGAAFVVIVFTLGSLVYGPISFLSFFTEGASELGKFTVKGMNLWPNLFIEVGELEKSTWKEFYQGVGKVLLAGSFFGLLALRNKKPFLKNIVVLLFLMVTLVLAFKAGRFTLFALLPLTLLFALAVETASGWLAPKPYPQLTILSLLVVLLGWGWHDANKNIRTVLTPIFNSTWNEALTAIKEKTPPDSIINTWWPPGHFIKAIAHRRVVFDGASLSEGETGYWMANIFLSPNEEQARGLVRMLDLSGKEPVEFLTQKGLKTSQAVALLKLIAGKSLPQAQEALKLFLSPQDAQHLLLLTRGGYPNSYLLVYNELVDENLGLVFVGRRDLQKVEAINADPQELSSIPSPNSSGFIDFLWTLSGGPSKYSDPLSMVNETPDTLSFTEGLNIRRDKTLATINSTRYGQGIPAGIVYRDGNQIVERDFPNANLNYMIVLYMQDQAPVCRLMDKSLADSLIMKLFFFDGAGLKHFKLIKSATDLTGRTQIKVFQVLWD